VARRTHFNEADKKIAAAARLPTSAHSHLRDAPREDLSPRTTPGYNRRTMSGEGSSSQARRCPFCGEPVSERGHSACAGVFREIMAPDFASDAGQETPPEAATAATDPSRCVHQYILVRTAGRGGMGAVWKAWDRKLTRWVALKFLLSPEDRDLSRFLREARLAARLRHPNIAAVHEVGEAPPLQPGLPARQFLVMEFVDGETLATARLTIDESLRIFAAVARAVDAAHRGGVIHRDLKPQNILLSRERWPYVADFGLAKSIGPGNSLSASGTVVGTPAYMAPEQALGKLQEIDERSDIYSLGATFYRVLCGRDPFVAGTALEVLRRVVDDEPPRPRTLNSDIPPAIDTVLRKSMSKTKVERYATASDLADDLDRHLHGDEIRGRAPGTLAIALKRARHSAVSLLLSFALLTAVAFLGWREWKGRPLPRNTAAAIAVDAESRRAAFREQWRDAFETERFRAASILLDSGGRILSDAERAKLVFETNRASRKFQDSRAGEFVRALARIRSISELVALTPEQYKSAFALPDLQELTEERPAGAWARGLRSLLDRIRGSHAEAWELSEFARSGSSLEEREGIPCFSASEPIAFQGLIEQISAETAAAAGAPRQVREACRLRVKKHQDRWSSFLNGFSAEFRRAHPLLEEQDREVARRSESFPVELKELAEVDLLACLRAVDPDAELDRVQKTLKSLESKTGVDLESRRTLYTMIVVAGAHRLLLSGSSEEDAAVQLRDYGPRLREVGGAAEIGAYSPRVLRVVDLVLRR
jgi:hypothetical protein